MVKKDSLTNIDIALFALYRLGGALRKIHTEHIAWEAYQMAPERFSWRLPEFRQREFPDKTAVRYALEQAKKKEGGLLVSGRAGGDVGGSESEGWALTTRGINWIKRNEPRIAEALQEDVVVLHPREINRFLAKIRRETAYIYFSEDRSLERVTPYMFTDLLECTPDASPEIIRKKYERMMVMANLVGDNDVIEFLNNCRNEYSPLVDAEGGS